LTGAEALAALADPAIRAQEHLTIAQKVAPCTVHSTHAPHTMVNERHHVFPQALQIALLGKVVHLELRVVCGTGHSTIHYGINERLAGRQVPSEIRGAERALVEQAVAAFTAAGGIVVPVPPTKG
jgi:hypothetical protein